MSMRHRTHRGIEKMNKQQRYIREESTDELPVRITQAHIDEAHQQCGLGTNVVKRARHCVLAKALRGNPIYGAAFSDVFVGHVLTKVLTKDGREIVFATPFNLRNLIKKGDKAGRWEIKPGVYTLGVPVHKEYTPEQKAKKAEYNRRVRQANNATSNPGVPKFTAISMRDISTPKK